MQARGDASAIPLPILPAVDKRLGEQMTHDGIAEPLDSRFRNGFGAAEATS